MLFERRLSPGAVPDNDAASFLAHDKQKLGNGYNFGKGGMGGGKPLKRVDFLDTFLHVLILVTTYILQGWSGVSTRLLLFTLAWKAAGCEHSA